MLGFLSFQRDRSVANSLDSNLAMPREGQGLHCFLFLQNKKGAYLMIIE